MTPCDAVVHLRAICEAAQPDGDLAPLHERVEHIQLALVKRAGAQLWRVTLADRAARKVCEFLDDGDFDDPVARHRVEGALAALRLGDEPLPG